MNEELLGHLKNPETWKRLLYMALFIIIFHIAEVVLAAVVAFQVVLTLIAGKRDDRVSGFGSQLSAYVYEILRYLTYASDEVPFPFSEWPQGEAPASQQASALIGDDSPPAPEAPGPRGPDADPGPGASG